MLTPEIKTNLILKEIGVKRYSLRKKKTDSLKKDIYYYQKGSILALLDKPFENFVEINKILLMQLWHQQNAMKGIKNQMFYHLVHLMN